MKETVQITREDREAAADALGYRDWEDANDYRLTGRQDRTRDALVQAFARHRLSATSAPAGVEGLREALEQADYALSVALDETDSDSLRRCLTREKTKTEAALAAAPAPSGQEVAGAAALRVEEKLLEMFPEWEADQRECIAAELALAATTPPASGVTVPEGEVAEVRDVLMTDRFGCKPAALSTPSATPGEAERKADALITAMGSAAGEHFDHNYRRCWIPIIVAASATPGEEA